MIVGCETGALACLITWIQADGLGVLVGVETKAVG